MSHEHTYSRALYTFFLLNFFDIIVLDFELPVALYFWCLIFWTLVSLRCSSNSSNDLWSVW